MDLARARYLVSPRGREALASLPAEYAAMDPNTLATALRRSFPAADAGALAEQVTLRAKAAARFGDESRFLYTPHGLEMITHPAVARRRAVRMGQFGVPLADLTCGLGGDLAALAAVSDDVIGLESDHVSAILARGNVPAAAVLRGDAGRPPLDTRRMGVVIDPARRSGTTRRFDPAAFSPPWGTAIEVAGSAAAAVVKAPPGLEHRHIPPVAEAEFVQMGRSMREAALWFGGDVVPGLRRAVLLPGGAQIDSREPEETGGPVAPSAIVFDPESCVTRAGLVRHLAMRLRASLMDEQVAYLTAPAPAFDALCATFEVVAVLPFSVARLRTYLRERGMRPDEIRRRAFPVEPDELRRLLGPLGGEPVTLLLTTLAGKRTVFVARRLFGAERSKSVEGCRQ